MTVLAVKNYKDRIVFAADSCCFIKESKRDNIDKIIQVNDIVFMSSGTLSELNFFELFCSTRKPESSKRLDILRFFIDFRKWQIETLNVSFDEYIINNTYIIYFDKKLYKVERDLLITEVKEGGYITGGYGHVEARTAMYLGHSPKEAIEVCVKLNVWTAGETKELVIYK